MGHKTTSDVVRAYLAWSRAHVATVITLLLWAMGVVQAWVGHKVTFLTPP